MCWHGGACVALLQSAQQNFRWQPYRSESGEHFLCYEYVLASGLHGLVAASARQSSHWQTCMQGCQWKFCRALAATRSCRPHCTKATNSKMKSKSYLKPKTLQLNLPYLQDRQWELCRAFAAASPCRA